MTNELMETAVQIDKPDDRRIYGVTVAQVINNVDLQGLGRVQLQLPWLTGIKPWARVATLMAGMNRGTYFIPQIGDEVLVGFNHGDIREPYVIGSLWNGLDKPPAVIPTDAVNKRIIRTPVGHEIEFDDVKQSLTITSTTKQKITLDAQKIQVETTGGTASIALDVNGNISVKATVSIELKAPKITINGDVVDMKSSASTTMKAGAACNIQAAVVKIN